MENKSFVGRDPDFKGSISVAIWKNTIKEGDNKGDTYLSIKIGDLKVNCYKNIPKKSKEIKIGDDF